MNYIKQFTDLALKDIPFVGGKNASLGEMIRALLQKGIRVPLGFAITADAYWYFLEHNGLVEPLKKHMGRLAGDFSLATLAEVGKQVRSLIEAGAMPADLEEEIIQAYHALSQGYGVQECDVAVRSSATAEDLPTASFAGQQETFLNVKGDKELINACKKSMASLFTDRAIVYRNEQGYDHFEVALSVGVQKMVRSDKSSAGVIFTLDTESGFKDIVMINSAYGLGESVVKGVVTPDEFIVHKPTAALGYRSIIKKACGSKETKIVYAAHETETVPVALEYRQHFSLTDDEIMALAQMAVTIEDHYSAQRVAWTPMDIEWAKDGNDGLLYIVQARPETIHSSLSNEGLLTLYTIGLSPQELADKTVVTGSSIGQKVVTGTVRVVQDAAGISAVKKGDILVTVMTDPDWVPAMKKAAAIITQEGGRTCHAAIVSRELGTPALVGAAGCMNALVTGDKVTVDCSRGKQGYVYSGEVPFSVETIKSSSLPKSPVPLMLNIGDPDTAFRNSLLPVDGVGLARLEFIITNRVKAHPMALLYIEQVEDRVIVEQIETITAAYADKASFFVETVAQSIGMIAAAFYPKKVIVRLSDFKSNEYRNLLGGSYFEPEEENPMIGFRGASRYYHERYKEAFALECQALNRVRTVMGFENVVVMVPFVRTLSEGEKVLAAMKEHGLERGVHGLEIIMMCEIPSNVVLIDEFSRLFDGFSIGSNDLTQLVLGVDRDSALLSTLFDERDPAVMKLLAAAIQGALRNDKYIGICGQAPSDFPELGSFLIQEGISSLSLNADSIVSFLRKNGTL